MSTTEFQHFGYDVYADGESIARCRSERLAFAIQIAVETFLGMPAIEGDKDFARRIFETIGKENAKQ